MNREVGALEIKRALLLLLAAAILLLAACGSAPEAPRLEPLERSRFTDPEASASPSAADAGDRSLPEDAGSRDYVLNTHTHKFHLPDCPGVASMKESNKSFYSGTRDELILQGYSPCGTCKP